MDKNLKIVAYLSIQKLLVKCFDLATGVLVLYDTTKQFQDYSNNSVVMTNEPLVLLGDFNIHVDVPTDMDAIQFRDLLDSMGLQQHVKQPTHIHGHTLDLLITRQSDVIVAKEPEIERYFSDHAVVLCDLRTAVSASEVTHAEFRKLKAIKRRSV